jgi:hypothetical protein
LETDRVLETASFTETFCGGVPEETFWKQPRFENQSGKGIQKSNGYRKRGRSTLRDSQRIKVVAAAQTMPTTTPTERVRQFRLGNKSKNECFYIIRLMHT